MGIRTRTLGAALVSAAGVAAHGHVSNIVVNGVSYQGYGADSFPYMANPPKVVGWTANQPDNGFVSPEAFGSADIICHNQAKPGAGHATVKAGDSISLQWNTWPESHHGPVLDYLANCNGPCESVDKTSLEFFKISGPGIVSGSMPGTWASDVLINNNFTWLVQIPATLAPGNYVLRHEILALHSAANLNGAQAYPQCFNLQVTGGGSLKPAGVRGTALYTATDPGILYDLNTNPPNYKIPGPAVVSGLPQSVAQVSSKITASASATLPGGGDSTPVTTTTSGNKPTTTPGNQQPATTLSTKTSAAPVTTPPPSGDAQTMYGQCGGSGWAGPTACASGSCKELNPWYAQCS